MTAAKAEEAATCLDCAQAIVEGVCDRCAEKRADEAWENGGDEREREAESPAERVRNWARRRHLLGFLTAEARKDFELLAEDMECGDA